MTPFRNKFSVIAFAAALVILQIIVAWPRIGSATYLADQLDQTGAFLQLLKGDWRFFYGPFMSGTQPPAHNFGPLGSILFGFPTWLGANPDQVHGLFILCIAVPLAILFVELHHHDRSLAYFWTAALFAMPSLWWHHSMLWVNAMLLPIIFLEITLFLQLLRKPSWPAWINLFAVFVLGLHIHASAIVGVCLVAVGFFLSWIRAKEPVKPFGWALSTVLLMFAVAPYILAEIFTGGQNFKAIVQNLTHFGAKNTHDEGLQAAFTSTNKVFTAIGLDGESWVLGSTVLLVCVLIFVSLFYRQFRLRQPLTTKAWLWLVWGLVFPLQFAFFYAMNRPLLSSHYTSFLIPFCAFPWVMLFSAVLQKLRFHARFIPVLAGAWLAFAFFFLPKTSEPGEWTYRNIKNSLTEICRQNPEIDTVEPVPFRAYDDSIDTLLKFIGKRYVDGCHFKSGGPVVLLPAMNFQSRPDSLNIGDRDFDLVKVMPPGIGIYKEKSARL